ncbi:cation:dicarboxylase symporter family transporter [bacterium]|nr:cation:dicarboxylase symporter family transporter [bacterium]
MKSSRLTTYIFIALILGIICGWLAPDFSVKLAPLATIFLNMVKMIVAPLLFATLVVGIAGHGDIKDLGKIGIKTLIYFEIVTTIALAIGLFIANVFQPGAGFNVSASAHNMSQATEMATIGASQSFSHFIVNLFPTSIFKAMADGNLLQIVIFAVFFAVAICSVGTKAKPFLEILNSLSEIMFKFTEYVMMFAPVGIFGAIAATVGENGLGVLASYAKVLFSVYFALAVFLILVIFIVCKIVGISFRALLQVLKDPALLAFSTASSEAALPKAMELMEKFGVPKNIVGFVMPTGYTFNLDGSTLYLSLAVLFSAQIVGIDLPLAQQLTIMLALMITSKGIAAVPRVALIVLAGTLSSFNIPLVGVAILLGIDQILDMGRTTVNLIGNCVATVVIARWENVFDYAKMHKFVKSLKHSKI